MVRHNNFYSIVWRIVFMFTLYLLGPYGCNYGNNKSDYIILRSTIKEQKLCTIFSGSPRLRRNIPKTSFFST